MKNDPTPISQLREHIGQEVQLSGWVFKCRPTGKLIFLTVRDGTGLCQCVVEKGEATEGFFDVAKHLAQESAVCVRGTVRADERAPGGCELDVTGVEVVHAAVDYPITPKPHGVEFLMKNRHLWFRSRRQFLILKIRATLVDAIRQFFNGHGFTLIDTLDSRAAGGRGGRRRAFQVTTSGEPVYLGRRRGSSTSRRRACRTARCTRFADVPAEKSKTRRHLTESDGGAEIAFAGLDDVIGVARTSCVASASVGAGDYRAEPVELGGCRGAGADPEAALPAEVHGGGGHLRGPWRRSCWMRLWRRRTADRGAFEEGDSEPGADQVGGEGGRRTRPRSR
ncbi:MAG: hypothetical protein H6816_15480 [Phycisphaerales bacterium]|nr:hypothetical protein [Phycisphaerales bacterium]